MNAIANYTIIWLIYLTASVGLMLLFWSATHFPRMPQLRYMLRAVMIALVYTPWFANPDNSVLAPALMILTLDAITIGPIAAVRTFVPLFLSTLFAMLVAGILYHVQKTKLRRQTRQE
ncbi:MAG: hypothetical protein ACR2PR_07950 [Pseudohongiellaceae bacterium]